jgi:hypothetical protein
MNRRQKLLQGKRAMVPRQIVSINTGDELVDVEVRGLSAGARGDVMAAAVITETDADGDTHQRTDNAKLSIALLIHCAYDPESQEPLFAEADRELLQTLNAKYLDPVILAASKLSGIDDASADDAEKNSARTGDNSTSGSSSPASSE